MKLEILSSSQVRIKEKGRASYDADMTDAHVELVPSPYRALLAKPCRPHDKPVACGPEMWSTLLPHQQEGLQRIVHQFNGRCLLADEMGLGKTLTAVAAILHFNADTLVICPAFLQTAWLRALCQWSARATVVTYDTIPGDRDFDFIVADEAHYLKTFESKRTQAALPLLLKARHVLLLSGTPCPNRPEELFVLLHAIRPNIIPSFHFFAHRYCNPRRTKFCALDTRGSDRPRELAWLLSRAFQIRRTKQQVLPHLPSKLEKVWHVDIDASAKLSLQPVFDKYSRAMEKGSKLAQTLMMELYRATAQAKLLPAVQAALHIITGPTLVFAHHQMMLDAMQEALAGKAVDRIDGSVALAKRQQIVDRFQQGKLDVIVLSIGAAGVGLTLTAACTAIFLELPWSPAALRQCEDRVHRIGQTQTCHMHYVLSNDTLDHYVWKTILRKESVANKLGFFTKS